MTSYAVPSDIGDLETLRLLKAEDVARIIQISTSQVYTLIQEGALQGVRFGRSVRVRPQDVEKFIEENLTTQEPRRGLFRR